MADVLTKKSKRPKKETLRTARKVLCGDLRIGMKIVTRWHKNLDLTEYIPEGLTESGAASWLADASEYNYVAKSMPIKQLEECPGQLWRTHIHVNKQDCYDTRQSVWIVSE
jgi:hypothetical protein